LNLSLNMNPNQELRDNNNNDKNNGGGGFELPSDTIDHKDNDDS